MTNKEIVDYLNQRISERADKIKALSKELADLEKNYAESKRYLEIQIIQLRHAIHALNVTRNMELSDAGGKSDHENQSMGLSDGNNYVLQLSESMSKVHKTIVEIAYEILQGSDRPLSVQEITQLAKPVYKFRAKKPEMSVTSALIRDPRFESVDRGIWKIKESDEENKSKKTSGDLK